MMQSMPDPDLRAQQLEEECRVYGGYVEYSPHGIPVRFTEAGQRIGGQLLADRERREAAEERRRQEVAERDYEEVMRAEGE